jgi:hypothetical protein
METGMPKITRGQFLDRLQNDWQNYASERITTRLYYEIIMHWDKHPLV